MGKDLQDILERKETLLIPNDMNNKEKAINIGENNLDRCFGSKIDYGVTCALEMAQWKDEQFSKFLLWLDDNYVIRKFTDGEPITYAELIDNFESNSHERNTTKTN